MSRPWGMSMKPPSLTIGIEEEYQIIDPETRELKSYITEILDGDRLILEQVKPELHQSMVEVGTKVCNTPAAARAELVKLRHSVISHVAKNGLRDRRGGHASVLVLGDAGDHAARALPRREGRHGGARAVAAHLRHARPHRHRGSASS